MDALIGSAAILGGVSKGAERVPAWRDRISEAVRPHGKLKEIADAAGMTSPQLQKIANGSNKNPGVQTLTRIASALGLTLSELTQWPRPEESGHADPRRLEGHPVLQALLDRLDERTPAEDTWRGDILRAQDALGEAAASLNRALRRPPNTGEPAAPTAKTGR